MTVDDIQTLYAYNRWANRRLFDLLDQLTEEQFKTPIQSSFPSIRETVFHILFAEWLWLKRWQGASPRASLPNPDARPETWGVLSPGGMPSVEELSTVEAVRSFAAAIDQERQALLDRLDEATLHAPLSYTDMSGKPFAMPLAELMQHVANHGTYHRGQVATQLRQLGRTGAALDMTYFFRETRANAAGV